MFGCVVKALSYEFEVYEIDEVGYKLSKRREKAKKNELCRFVGRKSGDSIPNVHLADEGYTAQVDIENPSTILDYIRRDVKWTACE